VSGEGGSAIGFGLERGGVGTSLGEGEGEDQVDEAAGAEQAVVEPSSGLSLLDLADDVLFGLADRLGAGAL